MSTSTSNIDSFSAQIEREFCQGSAIDPLLFGTAVSIVPDVEYARGEVQSTPIATALNWRFVRFGRQARGTAFAALLRNEDSSCWQAKLSQPRADKNGEFQKYETPVGNGSRAFLPPVPTEIRQRIAQRYGVAVPLECSFWDWVEDHPEVPIVWTEGGKKALSLLSLGYIAIALYGVNGGYRLGGEGKRQLIPDVQRFACPHRCHVLAFDQDIKAKTRRRVEGALFQFGSLLERTKGKVSIAQWSGKNGKGVDDLIVSCGPEAWEEARSKAAIYEQWQVRHYKQLTYEPSLELSRCYLGELSIPGDVHLAGIKAPKGSGKTESLKHIVESASAEGKRVLVVTHRVQLTQEICDRVGIRSIYELLKSRESKNKDEAGSIAIEMNQIGFGLCIDSLHPSSQASFDPEQWRGAIVVIDEAEQVIKHLLNSSTCRESRIAILQTFQRLIQVVLESGGRVVLSDADLCDVSIDFIKGLADCSDLDPWIVVNNWKPQPWQVKPYGSREAWLVGIEQAIKAGDRVLVHLDSQKPKGKYSSFNLERRWLKQFPNKRILRIDSSTLELMSHPAFGSIAAGLNKILSQYDVVICSPSIETGVSIDLKGHFNSVWGCFLGVVPVDSAAQALSRLREPVPRHVYAQELGLGKVGSGETSVKQLLASENKLIRAKLHQLYDSAIDAGEIDFNFLETATQTWAKLAAIDNAGFLSFKDSLLAKLKEEGHQIQPELNIADKMARSDVSELMKKIRDESQAEMGQAIAEAIDLTPAELEQLEGQRSRKDEAEQWAVAKGQLKRKYGVEVTKNLYLNDCEGFYPALQLHYYLTAGREYLKERDKDRITSLVQDGKLWMPDGNRVTIGDRIRVLELLKIPELLAIPEISSNHPLVQEIHDQAQRHKRDLKVILGFSADSRPIAVVKQFLGKLGLGLECLRKEGSRGKQVRIYRIVSAHCFTKDKPIADGRGAIFQAWSDRHESKEQRQSEATTSSQEQNVSHDTVVTDGNKYIKPSATTSFVTTISATTEQTSPQKPTDPPTNELHVGAVVSWGQRLSPWVVVAIEGAIAKVRQTSGYASRWICSADIGELRDIGHTALEQLEA